MTGRAAPFSRSRAAAALASLVGAALLACAVHGVLAAPGGPWDPLADVAAVAQRYALGTPALAHDVDLRHPNWARPEMPCTGQPGLVDPRPASRVIRPAPFLVQP